MSKRVFFCALAVVSCVFLFAGTAQGDTVRVTGAFTSFSGNILGQSQTFFEFCPADTCGIIGPPPPPVATCPDAGCGVVQGIANISIGGNPTFDTVNQLQFRNTGGTSNELDFRAARDPGSSLLNDVNPNTSFKLGTLTFENGIWTGDADFGFSIVANDLTIHRTERFDGFVHMALTPNTGTPAQNADFIYITNAAGSPVVSVLTLTTLPSIRAYELADSPTGSNTVSVDIFGRFGSLDLTSIENATGGGFIDVSLTQDLGGPPSQAPEPGTFALAGAGILALAAMKKRLG